MHSGGTEVAKGNHVVPKGVCVEELDGGKKKLADECPAELKTLLEFKGAKATYDELVKAVVEESNTRSLFGSWRDQEFVSIIDLFREEFAFAGIKVVLCKRKSGSGTFRWLEFIDVDTALEYVPQFDVSNFSGQVIRTCYTKIEFPNGVAVEELKQWGKARNKLRENAPLYVQNMMNKKGLMEEYKELVEHCADAGVGRKFKNWKTDKLQEIIEFHRQQFEAKGVAIFVSQKVEYVSHGQYGGHTEHFRWIEFVDREEQPNYHPQRDAGSKKEEECSVM